MNPIITKKLPELVRLCKKYRVETMYLFGSVTSDKFNENSDIDFLITFRSDVGFEDYADYYFDLLDDLRKLFNKEIDLVTEKSISNPYFKREVEQTRQLVYAA